jgi:hypothetical protein
MSKHNRDATKSLKGYIHQINETVLYLTNIKIKEIKFEGLEDIDLFYNDNNTILIQYKYHSKNKKSNNEGFGKNSGLYKVYKSFICNNDKYTNIKNIIYYIYCEDELIGTPQFKYAHEEFINFFENNKLKQFIKYIKEDIKDNTEIILLNLDNYNNNFIKLIQIKISENYKINFDDFYVKIINLNLFEIKNKNAPYINEYLYQLIYRYLIEHIFNNNEKNIIIKSFIENINNEINKNITVKNIFDDLIVIYKYEKNTNLINDHINLLFSNDLLIDKCNIEQLFELFNLLENDTRFLKNKIIQKFTIKIISIIDINNINYIKIFNSIIKHIKSMQNHKCKYKHFKNLLEGKKFNKKID